MISLGYICLKRYPKCTLNVPSYKNRATAWAYANGCLGKCNLFFLRVAILRYQVTGVSSKHKVLNGTLRDTTIAPKSKIVDDEFSFLDVVLTFLDVVLTFLDEERTISNDLQPLCK